MSINLFLPLCYLLIGWGLAKTAYDFKNQAALLVNKIVIPCVIIYNIATYEEGVFSVIIGMMLMMAFMLWLGKLYTRDPIQRLCLCYLNIAWFGLPVAGSLLGDGATKLLITAYIGNSLFGNPVSAGLLQQDLSLSQRLYKVLISPSLIALIIGLCLIPLHQYVTDYTTELYRILKWIMGFLGMFILGAWLAKVQLNRQELTQAVVPFVIRSGGFAILIFFFIQFANIFNIALITQNQPALYLLALLPPAANIVVLETFYLKTGTSAIQIAYGTCFSIVAIGLYLMGLVMAGVI